MTPILDLEEKKRRNVERVRKWLAVPENRERARKGHRERWAAMTPEQKDQKGLYSKLNPHLRKKYHLKRTYNLTPEEWEQLFESQGRRCGICRADSKKWHTDHCHITKRVRGILCHACNVGLGYFKDNHEALMRAANYLVPSSSPLSGLD